jgi:hypothetical protein
MQQHINIFDAKTNIDNYGIWYAIWFHGTSCYALWTIFVACRMIKHDRLVRTTKLHGIVNSWVDHWGFGPFDTSYVSASGLGVGASGSIHPTLKPLIYAMP